jgi:conflict system STAND superfamily ATPase
VSAPIDSDYTPDLPYPGIDAFGYKDRNVFFARAQEIRSLLRLVVLYRGVLLYSDSGTGKSSLINAGLLPSALADGLQPERVRVQPREGEEIVVQLSEKIGSDSVSYPSIFTSDRNLERVVLSLGDFEERLRQHAANARPLLVFDQFEEWVTLFEETGGADAARDARQCQEKIRNTICALINDTKRFRCEVLGVGDSGQYKSVMRESRLA